MRWLRAIPVPLRVLLAVALVESLAWTCALPAWQGPDEARHFAYVQKIGETGHIPWTPRAGGAEDDFSTEQRDAYVWAGLSDSLGNASARPAWTTLDERLWDVRARSISGAQRGDGGHTSASRNPPLYYLYATVPYLLLESGSVFTRAFVTRLANIPALLAVVALTWLLAGELFGLDRWRQTVAAGAVAVEPQLVHMSAVTNPDLVLAAFGAGVLYLSTLVARRGASRPLVLALVAAVAGAALTHARGLAFAVPAGAALAVALRGRRGRPLVAAVLGAAAVLLAAATWYATRGASLGRVREFASYLWQFYLPRLGFMAPAPGSGWNVRDVFVDRFYGTFAGLEVGFSSAVYTVLAVASLLLVALALAGLWARREVVRAQRGVLAVLASAVVAMLLLLHAEAFRSLSGGSADPIITGRYLLPLIPLFGAGVAVAVGWLPRTPGRMAGAFAVSALAVVQICGLGLVVTRFNV